MKDSIPDSDPDKRVKIRDYKVKRYSEKFDENPNWISQPSGKAGLVVPFYNNILHKGGFPKVVGKTREVIVFHFYPTKEEAPFDLYRSEGMAKTGSFPKNPEF